MKIQELLNKKLETIVLKILRELQENIDKQFSDIRKTIEKKMRISAKRKKT